MHPNLKNAYAKTLETQKRFLDKAALTGWFVWLELAVWNKPIALVWDYDCPKDQVFILDTSTWALAVLDDIQYLHNGANWILHPAHDTNGKLLPAYQITMKMYLNLVCLNARANARLINKTTT
jgi:hypothetical protein